jgi:hypothetical protein
LEQKLLSEQWLLSNGLITETSADNLLGYAYMQPGVESAKITIDPDDANEGKNPTVTYTIILQKSIRKAYRTVNSLAGKQSLFSKLRLLWLLNKGIPAAGSIEANVRRFASSFLPERYLIEVICE